MRAQGSQVSYKTYSTCSALYSIYSYYVPLTDIIIFPYSSAMVVDGCSPKIIFFSIPHLLVSGGKRSGEWERYGNSVPSVNEVTGKNKDPIRPLLVLDIMWSHTHYIVVSLQPYLDLDPWKCVFCQLNSFKWMCLSSENHALDRKWGLSYTIANIESQ